MAQRYNILIVDDERSLVHLLQAELQSSERFDVDVALDGAEAINKLQSNIFDVVLLDVRMPRVGGLEVLKFLQEQAPQTQVIMLTNYADVKTAIETIKLGAYDFIAKPYDYDELIATIERALERRQLYIDNELMKNALYGKQKDFTIIGKSRAIADLVERARKVAETDSIVLIQGASGTGKELVAHLIHRASQRSDRPFVAMNCASIPDSLLESELFGYERGAFTNAYNTKQGLVEVAQGGTLFLDEVGDISQTIQPKLLRFLETGEFRRVGGTNTLKVNVRIISATNKDLQTEAQEGRFREDLLYRLNVVTLHLPPLKDRKEDIPLLVDHFLSKHVRSKVKKRMSQQAFNIIMEHDWPGNIRELEHVIEGAIILSSHDVIEPEDLTLNSNLSRSMKPRTDKQNGSSNHRFTMTTEEDILSLEELEKQHIQKVLEQNEWSRVKTAQDLGITPKTLYLKIKRYNIDTP
jgi:two-component system, NtrC family, response regulator AtoC